ncbi:low temperature-induced protein [Paenibacillus sp. IHB B 3415]|uniref:general stress protein n=1 Tax=Paenibacillus sp. IHB B 3415 TaxID=867080 RepID=UPI00057306E7|nr:general stress protein [Paenibacillus sp. IHB B 3415]KHL97279.1 low temperature-induced protein [Paenibacillus sp. IHB B 3415]
MTDKIVGVFDTEQEATRAIESLQSQGFTNDDISVITRDRDDLKSISEDTGTMAPEGVATGAATGGVVGGITGLLAGIGALAIPGIGPILAAGPIVATLTGAAIGAGAGGLVGGLIGLGIPEDEARDYEGYVDSGKILVLVDDNGRGRDIHNVFRGNRSLNASRYDSLYADDTANSTLTDRGPTNPDIIPEDTRVGNTLGNRGAMNADRDPDLYNRDKL